MTSGGKRPYLDFQKYKYDEEKRSLFSFGKKKEKIKSRQLKVYEMPPQDPINYSVGSNPFRKETGKKINFRKYFSIFFISAFFISWFWLMFYLPYFDIDDVAYYGIKALNAEEIKNFTFNNYLKSGKYWHKNNYFVVNTEDVVLGIKQNFDISDVKVIKIFPNKLQIDIIEKNQTITYCTRDGYYLLDSDGTVVKTFWEKQKEATGSSTLFATTTNTSFSTSTEVITTTAPIIFVPNKNKIENDYRKLPLFCLDKNENLNKNQRNIFSADFLKIIVSWQESLLKEGIGAPEYFIGGQTQQSGLEAHFKDRRWYLKISPDNIDQQILKLKAILTGNEGGAKANEYIDVRFGDRVFWK